MKKRKLGSTGFDIAPLVLGGNVFGWTLDETASFRVLDGFVGAGGNLIDTADVYSRWVPGNTGGESETLIGRWMKARGNRSRVLIATKVGIEMGPGKKGLAKARIYAAVDESLRRLQTDHIDLYQSHVDDLETPQLETLEAYAELVKSGKVRAIGASQLSAERLREALTIANQHGLPAYQTLQPEYNLHDRTKFETDYLALCQEHGLGVICYYGLASGFLSGKYRSEADFSKSPRGARMKAYLTDRGGRILAALDDVGARSKVRPATVALAWLMARPGITAPIASATSLDQLAELTAAAELVLDAGAMEQLNQASA